LGAIALTFYCISANAQVYADDGYFVQRFARVKDEATFNVNGSVIGLKYSEINGSPFWNNEYFSAAIYKGLRKAATTRIKLNLFTNEIYFLKDSQELVLEAQGITEVVLFNAGDTSTFIRGIPNISLNKNNVDGFIQVLNKGHYQLLKYLKKSIGTADSAMSYKRYYFSDMNYYFLKSGEKAERIKKLDEKSILSLLPKLSTHQDWIKLNAIDFRREKDVVKLIRYYNSILPDEN
jgi:hypothetical protein